MNAVTMRPQPARVKGKICARSGHFRAAGFRADELPQPPALALQFNQRAQLDRVSLADRDIVRSRMSANGFGARIPKGWNVNSRG